MWLIKQDPASLDPMDKYYSCCDVFGKAYSFNKKVICEFSNMDL